MKIGLIDHMGWGNMGDAAIQEAFIANIKKRLPGAELVAFSLYPEDTTERHRIVCYPINWACPSSDSGPNPASGPKTKKSRIILFAKRHRALYTLLKRGVDSFREAAFLLRSYRIVRRLDLLVFSGGGQLCELYGPLPYNVFKFCVMARLSNTPVYLVGVGADLLRRPLNKFFAKWAVRLATYASFRSVESQALIRKLGVTRKTFVCPDPLMPLVYRIICAPETRMVVALKWCEIYWLGPAALSISRARRALRQTGRHSWPESDRFL